MRSQLLAAALVGLGLAGSVDALPAPAPPTGGPSQCFLSSEWDGWKATPDAKTIYIRVGLNRFYRLDLASSCPALNMAGVHLVTKLHGPWICNALDLDLHVADGHGLITACIVSKVVPLSPAEAAALPRDVRP